MARQATTARCDVPSSAAKDQDARIARARAGDRRALASLLEELLPRVRNLVRYLVRGDQHVDDIAQEALIAVARGLPSYRGEGALASWADRVVVRVTFSYLKKVRRDEAMQIVGPDLYAVPHPDGPPDEYARRRQLVEQLDELPPEQRQALVLHHVLGMSVPEIAAEIDTPAETIRSRLRLGRSKLRALRRAASEAGGIR